MTRLAECERHVLDDVKELVATLGIATPLLDAPLTFQLEADEMAAARFLRSTLTRHVILVLTRLHSRTGSGATGDTASLESYIGCAEAESALTAEQATTFRSQRSALLSRLEANGIPFADLWSFRTAELAHSLIPASPLTNKLMSLPIWDCAFETYELAVSIEQAVSNTGVLRTEFEEWRKRGNAFWAQSFSDGP